MLGHSQFSGKLENIVLEFGYVLFWCWGKDSPNFKIPISFRVSGTFDKFKIFMDCGCLIAGSCNSRFIGNYGQFDNFH